jgi:hypothetical protein
MTGLVRLIALGAMILPLPSMADAQETGLRSLPHVRGENAGAREILEKARARSPTVARLVAELQETDVIVFVVAGWLAGRAECIADLIATTRTVRYVRVVLRLPNAERRLMAVLGHELQHAVEIARMPAVRDARSLAAAYLRIGVPMARNTDFETQAAVKTGQQVAREVGPR